MWASSSAVALYRKLILGAGPHAGVVWFLGCLLWVGGGLRGTGRIPLADKFTCSGASSSGA